MTFSSLRDFVAKLENAGRLVRVAEPVSTVLEMTEIQTRLLAEAGPAVLFENPVGADGAPCGMPVLVNLFGTVERVAWGMGKVLIQPGNSGSGQWMTFRGSFRMRRLSDFNWSCEPMEACWSGA